MLWDVGDKGVAQRITNAHNGVCHWVDVNGDILVSGGNDGTVKVFTNRPKLKGGRKRDSRLTNGHMEEDVTEAIQRQMEADAESRMRGYVKEEP